MAKGAALFDLTGRTALVTGSSQGIGLAIARGLAEAGAKVVLNARRANKLDEACAALGSEGLDAYPCAFDVTDQTAVTQAIAALERDGPIDILVNNAGIQRRAPFEDFKLDVWQEIVGTNLHSAFYVSQAVGRHMVNRKRGKIINICSVMSELGRPTIVPYTATKGALKMMTKGLCAEWGKHNIQVNGIGPGYIKTELNAALIADETFSAWVRARTPAGRWAEVDELIGAAVFLASDASNYVNGHILYVDGGITAVV
ncbi:MAG: glucose 1-dehydrogenase [Methylobacteriaceae bacterium]|nr:glucose 1-dehydrogenase [Methylobacteriaceae bacterium]MBV9636160.1 glucose 1-dehydrogenase [Methylobacteriaceae bacterium]MBV9701459.1 glucose 1-dehydrogenase [Methylobacteriaceae bacterium]